ncbi:MAG: tetratricopeptide repeat-containing sensor histidine kinase [Mucilaginibacter sp.]
MKSSILFVLLIYLSMTVAANPSAIDTTQVNNLNKQAASHIGSNPDSAFYFAKKSIILARKINYKSGLANGLLQAGHVNYFKGNSAEAIKNFDEAISIYKSLNDQRGLAACYVQYGRMYNLLADYKKNLFYLNKALAIDISIRDEYALTDCNKNIGTVYFSQGQLSKALDFYYQALFMAIKNHYNILTAELYNNIGTILQNMEVFPNALEYYKKALAIFEHTDNLQALGTINENVGEVLLAQADYDNAIVYLEKANKIVKNQNDKDGLGSVYTDLGLCYAHKNDFKTALNYLDTSLRISVKYKIVYNQAYAAIGFATVYNLEKDYKRAYPYAIQGQQLAEKLGNLLVRANAALQLNLALAGLGRLPAAYKELNKYVDLKKKLKDNESIQKLTSYNFDLTFSVKQRLLEQQQRNKDLLYQQNSRFQRMINYVSFIIILAMILIAGIYYRGKLKQQKINVLLKASNTDVLNQKAALNEQAFKLNDLNAMKDRLIAILAHDLRAPLSTLRGLFDLLQDDSISHREMLDLIPLVIKKLEYTSDFLDTLLFWINSQMENFENATRTFSVAEVVNRVTKNLEEQVNDKKTILKVAVPTNLLATADPDSIGIVIRNLITNAIKFCDENDIIEVSAKQQDQNVLITVKDTGTGMSPDQTQKLFKIKVESQTGTRNESGTGMGLLFCKDLVEKCRGHIWVTSEMGAGTTFSFTIPIA